MTDRLRLSCSEVDDLAALYVLDALGAAEAAEAAAHLADHAARHPSFAELGGVTPFLAESIDPIAPPPELRARVMGAVAATPQAVLRSRPAAPTAPAAAPAFGDQTAPEIAPAPTWTPSAGGEPASSYVAIPSWTPVPAEVTAPPVSIDAVRANRATRSPLRAVLAAAAVLALVVLSGWNVLLQQQGAESDRRMALLTAAIAAAGQPGATVAPMTGSDLAQGAGGYAVFPPEGDGFIVLTGLPSVGADQTWQAWTLADGQPSSAGLMTVGTDGLAVLEGVDPIPGTSIVALTVEPAGGSDAPTMNPLVMGQLAAPLAGSGRTLASMP